MNDIDDSRALLEKADAFLNRRRAQLGNPMSDPRTATTENPADDFPLLTEVVSEVDPTARPAERKDFSADVAREMEAWLDENLPQVVLHALDGVGDRLISMVHDSARADLLPRLQRIVGKDDSEGK